MRRSAAVLLLCAGLSANPGCAHRQLTNRDIAIGAVVVTGVVLLVYLAVEQCHKGATFCDNESAR